MYPRSSKIPTDSSHAETERVDRPCILTINGSSSSLRFALFALTDGLERLLSGRVERIGMPGTRLIVAEAGREQEDSEVEAANQAAGVADCPRRGRVHSSTPADSSPCFVRFFTNSTRLKSTTQSTPMKEPTNGDDSQNAAPAQQGDTGGRRRRRGSTRTGPPPQDGRLLAGRELPVGRPDLPLC